MHAGLKHAFSALHAAFALPAFPPSSTQVECACIKTTMQPFPCGSDAPFHILPVSTSGAQIINLNLDLTSVAARAREPAGGEEGVNAQQDRLLDLGTSLRLWLELQGAVNGLFDSTTADKRGPAAAPVSPPPSYQPGHPKHYALLPAGCQPMCARVDGIVLMV